MGGLGKDTAESYVQQVFSMSSSESEPQELFTRHHTLYRRLTAIKEVTVDMILKMHLLKMAPSPSFLQPDLHIAETFQEAPSKMFVSLGESVRPHELRRKASYRITADGAGESQQVNQRPLVLDLGVLILQRVEERLAVRHRERRDALVVLPV